MTENENRLWGFWVKGKSRKEVEVYADTLQQALEEIRTMQMNLPEGVGLDDLEVRVWNNSRRDWFPYEASAEE